MDILHVQTINIKATIIKYSKKVSVGTFFKTAMPVNNKYTAYKPIKLQIANAGKEKNIVAMQIGVRLYATNRAVVSIFFCKPNVVANSSII